MDDIQLTAQPRTVVGKQVGAMRRAGNIPAVLYGKHLDSPLNLQIDEKNLKVVVSKAGTNRLIKLTVDNGDPRLVLTRDVQRNSITRRIVHVDFQEVAMNEKITTDVPLVLVGTSSAVTRGEGLLIHGINTVSLRLLPGDLIPEVQVDVTVLVSLNQGLYVKDLKLGDKIEIMTPGDEMVAKVVPVKEEVVTTEAPIATAEVEVIKKGKIEEEGEGEAADGKKPEAKADAKK